MTGPPAEGRPTGADLATIGEFGVIARIIDRLGDAAARDIVVPPGDDAAAWAVPPGLVVTTTDAATEGRHWRRDTMSHADAGWRAVAACVSDLAAMGAIPDAILVALLAGPDLTLEGIDGLTDGMAAACRSHAVSIAGGDVVRAAGTALTVTALGHVPWDGPWEDGRTGEARLLRRNAARPGDAIAVSGWPGASAAGLTLIEAGRTDESETAALVNAHRRPAARLTLGRAAVASGIRCAIDISDGLAQDLGHVATASRVGLTVYTEVIPCHPAAIALLGEQQALALALEGGEDYELALTGPAEVLRTLSTPDLPVTVIGEVTAEPVGGVRFLDGAGRPVDIGRGGWDSLQ